MNKTEFVAAIEAEDLARLRMATAKDSAVQLRPDAYSATEIEQARITYWKTMGDVLTKYGADATRNYEVNLSVGVIYYEDER